MEAIIKDKDGYNWHSKSGVVTGKTKDDFMISLIEKLIQYEKELGFR